MRKIIAALQVSLDGFIEGPNGEIDWIEAWEDPFELLPQIDALALGGGMYPGYEAYWSSINADPEGIQPLTGKRASPDEVSYARYAAAAQHYVVSRKLQSVHWKNTRILKDIRELDAIKRLPGKDIHAVGGADFVSSLINHGLVDEIRLVIVPILLGTGKPLFKGLSQRHALQFVAAKPLKNGLVCVTYLCRN